MKAFKALSLMIEMADSIREDLPPELRQEMADISEEVVAMRNRYSQMAGISVALPAAEELETQ